MNSNRYILGILIFGFIGPCAYAEEIVGYQPVCYFPGTEHHDAGPLSLGQYDPRNVHRYDGLFKSGLLQRTTVDPAPFQVPESETRP